MNFLRIGNQMTHNNPSHGEILFLIFTAKISLKCSTMQKNAWCPCGVGGLQTPGLLGCNCSCFSVGSRSWNHGWEMYF